MITPPNQTLNGDYHAFDAAGRICVWRDYCDGHVREEITYEAGVLRSHTIFFADGSVQSVCEFLHDAGMLRYRVNDVGGHLILQGKQPLHGTEFGIATAYDPSKKIRSTGPARRTNNGKLIKHGVWHDYNSTQGLVGVTCFVHGAVDAAQTHALRCDLLRGVVQHLVRTGQRLKQV